MVKYPMRSRDFSEFTVGTLASLSAGIIPTKMDANRLQGCSIRKLNWTVGYLGKTSGVTEGPLAFGICKGMTIGEIANFYAADPQSSKADDVSLMESQFPILELGRIGQVETNSAALDYSHLRRAKWPGWQILEGQVCNHYMFNANPGDPMATGMFLQIYTESLGDWLND